MNNFDSPFDELVERGLVEKTNNENGIRALLDNPPAVIYAGFDPTATSLHIGSLTIVRTMSILQKLGHKIIFLVGGGTGLIGDPTGKQETRKKMEPAVVRENAEHIIAQMERLDLLHFSGENPALLVNNYDWLSKFSFLEDFGVEIGPLFSVNYMMSMTTFSKRFKENENISLSEFVYPVLQAWDFLVLYEKYGCRIQVGGKDQWANILLGADLVRRKHGDEKVFALTQPLLETKGGKKMGKTEKGAVWLDPEKTSPFDMYQYIEKTPDELLDRMFKIYTDLSIEEIKGISKLSPRDQQKRLAFEFTAMIHGKSEAQKAERDAARLYGKEIGETESIPIFPISSEGVILEEILVESKILPSKSEVRRKTKQRGISIDGKKVLDSTQLISSACTIKVGKKAFLKVVLRGE